MKSGYKKILSICLFFTFLVLIISCNKDSDKKDELSKTDKTTDKSNQSATDSKSKIDSSKTNVSSDDFIIDYNISGEITGNMSIYRNGIKFKQVLSSKILGITSGSAVYILDNNVYSITEVGGKTYGKKSSIEEFNKTKQTGETIVDINEFQKYLKSKKLKGNENIIGYDCEVYETAPELSISVYNKKYVLKIQNPQFIAIATKLEMNPPFEKNEFEVPKNVDFKPVDPKNLNKVELDSIMKKLKK